MTAANEHLPNPGEYHDIPPFFTFKNDYIFVEAMKKKKVLIGFLKCLTGFNIKSIKNITVLPRHLDKDSPVQKLGILDCKLELNDDSIVNIELQVLCYPNWDSRSLFYICKMLTDQYHQGPTGYSNIKRCIHICILDFNFTEIEDDFYSIYKFRDKDGRVYSDLMEIHVIQLKKRSSPGVEENHPELYRWTQLFMINSRKELESMTEQDEYIRAAAQAMDDLNLDEAHREAAFYRYLQLMDEQTILTAKEALEMQNERLNVKVKALTNVCEALTTEKETLASEKATLASENNALKDQLEHTLLLSRNTLNLTLNYKFGALPDTVVDQIEQQKDLTKLNLWLTIAYEADSFSSFIEAVPELKEKL